MKDEKTLKYFDSYTPEYGAHRLEHAILMISRLCKEGDSVLDIGCGTGNILEVIKKETGLHVYGIDISKNCLLRTEQRVKCQTFLGSILDDDFMETIPLKFDFVIIAAVLHHLVGKSRRQSRDWALKAIYNSLELLREGGHLIIVEPTFSPPFSMGIIFYIKKILSTLTSRRIQVFGKWNNIGAPVVSYYTNEELLKMIEQARDCTISNIKINERSLNLLWRIGGVSRRTDTTIVISNN